MKQKKKEELLPCAQRKQQQQQQQNQQHIALNRAKKKKRTETTILAVWPLTLWTAFHSHLYFLLFFFPRVFPSPPLSLSLFLPHFKIICVLVLRVAYH